MLLPVLRDPCERRQDQEAERRTGSRHLEVKNSMAQLETDSLDQEKSA